MTIAGGAEASERLMNGGGSLALQSAAGEIEMAGRISRLDRRHGHAWSVGYGYRGRALSIQAIGRRMSPGFAELGMVLPAPAAEEVERRESLDAEASLGVVLPGAVRLTATHALSKAGDDRRERSQLLGQVGIAPAVNLLLGIASTRTQDRRAWTASAALTLALGGRTSASVNALATPDQPVDVVASLQRAAPQGVGLGYQLQWRGTPSRAASAALVAHHAQGRVELRHDETPSQSASGATIAGALAVVGGSWHLTRPIDDAFAVVRVGDVRGVRTYVSNQLVGRTGRGGDLMLPSLSSYYGNHVSIEDRDVPIGYEIGATEARVAPGFRGGSIVSFDVRAIRLVSGRFALPARPVLDSDEAEAIAEVKWPGGPERVTLGPDGGFVFEHAAAGRHKVRITLRGEEYLCGLDIRLTPGGSLDVQALGTIPCSPTQLRPPGVSFEPTRSDGARR
ncbi:MAG TPA: fimbria/pilus outer membrane usher protein [Vicinamibacterales bacterium]|nr:fimbria/pilus outer membrane usher protein [Vicinamibacterales bacterium]